MEKCIECFGKIISKNFERFCSECGIVVEESPIYSTSSFTNQEFSTFSAGGSITYKKRKVKNVILADKREVAFFILKKEIERICQQMNLPTYIQQNTITKVSEVIERKLSVGRNFGSIIGACVYLSVQESEMVLSLVDLSEYCDVELKSLENSINKFNHELNMNLAIPFQKIRMHLIDLVSKKIIDKNELIDCLRTIDSLSQVNVSEKIKAVYIAFVVLNKQKEVSIERFCKRIRIKSEEFARVCDKIQGALLLSEWQKTNSSK